ncbi:hypothetical protein CYMTET_22085 [Cymbomonas tetramitiformis]|uniref:Major facilitator superfamily (MFS) profile domain-containing protein n=1 Tax=Cymbomonas tetramitiformis TaxID=36881 RepID=A0AAE0F6Y2_9CHLO|nr:hypothetical protein CYMTET_37143 [Cymbomonas tetramitiformis]KAK3269475.1 hypothetical protein CYMTET_22085 [Cymbomonas tetramitiformis]
MASISFNLTIRPEINLEMHSNKTALYTIYVNIVLFALCYQLQSPLEPYLVSKLSDGDDNRAYSSVQAWFSFIQTIGSLLMGSLLDKFGLQGGFVLTFLSSAVHYGILANATTLQLLYISKIPTLFMHGFLCAQTAVSQLTTDGSSRMAALGRLTACYTAGATVGPALGGYLGASGDYYFGAKLAVCGSLLSAVLSYAFVPAHLVTSASETEPPKADVKTSLKTVFLSAYDLFLVKGVTGVANSMQSTAFPLIAKNYFSFQEEQMGLAQSAMTLATTVCSIFLPGPLTSALGSSIAVVRLCLWGSILGLALQTLLLAYAVENLITLFFISKLFVSVFQFLLSTSLTGESVGRVPAECKGTLMGTEHALFSVVRVFTPALAVAVLEANGVIGVSAYAAVMYTSGTGLFAMTTRFIKQKEA